MPSFRTLVLSAMVALASFTAATPVANPSVASARVVRDIPDVVVRSSPTSLSAIIAGITTQVNDIKAGMGMFVSVRLCAAIIPDGAPPLVPLVGKNDATVVPDVQSQIEALKTVLGQAVADVQSLTGLPVDEVLAVSDGVLTILGVIPLIGGLLTVRLFS